MSRVEATRLPTLTCALAEQHAVRVHQEDLAVGVDAAQDAAAFIADDAVQRDRVLVGLSERDAFLGADVEALPVGDQLVALLVHDHLLAFGLIVPCRRPPLHPSAGHGPVRRRRARSARRPPSSARGRVPPCHGGVSVRWRPASTLGSVPDQRVTLVHSERPLSIDSAAPQQMGPRRECRTLQARGCRRFRTGGNVHGAKRSSSISQSNFFYQELEKI